MQHSHRWIAVLPLVAALYVSGCTKSAAKSVKTEHAKVNHIDGSELSRVTLTAKAAERLGIATGVVRDVQATASGGPGVQGDSFVVSQAGAPTAATRDPRLPRSTSQRSAVPYAAVLYDAKGNTWVYTTPSPLVFVRHSIKIEYILGDTAILSEGPPSGTAVVTLGAAELFGAEFEVGH